MVGVMVGVDAVVGDSVGAARIRGKDGRGGWKGKPRVSSLWIGA